MDDARRKKEQRAQLLERRNALQDRDARSAMICARLLCLPHFVDAKHILFYAAIGSEPDLRAAMDAAWAMGKEVYLPRCAGKEMEIVRVSALSEYKKSIFGVWEPQGDAQDAMILELVLCPGVGFDRQYGRMGYGKGYFDRFSQKTRAFFIGICYTACIVDALVLQAWDKRMDGLVTERDTLYGEDERL